jgi:Inosine-uridine nucleoside N-ribohydrolase
MDKTNLIIDCDTGLDDMVALIYALNREEFNIKGVIAVAGNQTVDKTLKNTLMVTEAINSSIPVYKGSERPLLRERVTASDFHGETGLKGPIFPPLHKEAENEDGIDFLIRTLKEEDKTTLVFIGPLTDLAAALKKDPSIKSGIDKAVIMGSSFSGGNVTKFAEFNTYADPEAADIVYSSGIDVVLMSLDVTHQITIEPETFKRISRIPNLTGDMLTRGLSAYMEAYRLNGEGVAKMHDPSTICYLLHPDFFSGSRHSVSVNTDSTSPRYGETVKTSDDGHILCINHIRSQREFWSDFIVTAEKNA